MDQTTAFVGQLLALQTMLIRLYAHEAARHLDARAWLDREIEQLHAMVNGSLSGTPIDEATRIEATAVAQQMIDQSLAPIRDARAR